MLSCPMTAKNRTLGRHPRLHRAGARLQRAGRANLLLNLANLGAVAIENARSYGDLQRARSASACGSPGRRTTSCGRRSRRCRGPSTRSGSPDRSPARNRTCVARARRRIQDAFDTIRDLLDLAAAQSVEPPRARRPRPSGRRARARSVESAQERCRAKGLTFGRGPRPAGARRADGAGRPRARLRQPARQRGEVHAERAGRPRGVDSQDGRLEVVVEDTGMGIAPDDLAAYLRELLPLDVGEGERGSGHGPRTGHRAAPWWSTRAAHRGRERARPWHALHGAVPVGHFADRRGRRASARLHHGLQQRVPRGRREMCFVHRAAWGDAAIPLVSAGKCQARGHPCRLSNISCVENPTTRSVGHVGHESGAPSEAAFPDRHPYRRASRHHRRVRADDGRSGRAVRRRRPGDRGSRRVVAARTGAASITVTRRIGSVPPRRERLPNGGATTGRPVGRRFVVARLGRALAGPRSPAIPPTAARVGP